MTGVEIDLGRTAVFSTLSPEELSHVGSVLQERTFAQGEPIFSHGDAATSMLIVVSGQIQVFVTDGRHTEVLATFTAGDTVGELALLEPGSRSADARALSDVVALEMRGADFDRLRDEMHPIAFKLIREVARVTCRRIRDASTRVKSHLEDVEAVEFDDFAASEDDWRDDALITARRAISRLWQATGDDE